MKRIICILLGLSLLLGTVSFAYAEEDDVDYSDEELAEMEAEEKTRPHNLIRDTRRIHSTSGA